jgi:methylisocitrate lyase
MRSFREVLAKEKPLIMPGVYDALSARLARQAGFEAMFISGYSVAATQLGVPDIGLLTQTEMLDAARRVCRTVDCPVIVDADTGYGGVSNIFRTIKELEAAGAGGCFLEDQVWPKKCGHMQGKKVVSLGEHVMRIRAACDARKSRDFFIVARTDARAAENSLEEAIKRAEACKKAGADALFIEAPQSIDELKEIAGRLEPPFVANMLEGGVTPLLDRRELAELGFTIAVFPLTGLYASAKSLTDVYGHLREKGETRDIVDKLLTFHDFHGIVGLDSHYALDKKYRVE